MATSAVRRRRDQPWNPRSSGPDISTVFVLFAAGPLLLPLLGHIDLTAVSFAAPLPFLAYAALRCWGASRRAPLRRAAWLGFAATALLAGAATTAVVASELLGTAENAALELGAAASIVLLLAVARLTRETLSGLSLVRAVDALLFALVAVAAGLYFVVVPGAAHGDALLTAVVVVDLLALLAASIAVVGMSGGQRRVALALLLTCASVTAGDALVAVGAAELLAAPRWATGILWTLAAAALAAAPRFEDGRPAVEAAIDPGDSRWVRVRVMLPFAAVIALPVMAVLVGMVDGLDRWSLAYFGGASTLLLALAFWRQAQVLVENRRAVARERALREEVVRRNADLEALTGLATTMTQTLEEMPIVEHGLGVLHLASKATSAALHTGGHGGEPSLLATAGDWQREGTWARGGQADAPELERRAGREVLRLPLAARGEAIGTVTLMRPARTPFRAEEVDLLRILGDQLAMAVQNARDYRDKLEQAVRDPLTGLYNRRYFFEALEKEVLRAARYGSHSSLVIFDIDDFKQINDTYGHAAGDEVLRRVGETVNGLIRDVDSFARIGGEEFALLLPQTQQLDALLVAERVRSLISRQELLPDRRVTLSGGVSSCPLDATTREELARAADTALYWAKRNGKNICALASEARENAPAQTADGVVPHLYALVSAIDASHLHTRDHSENVAAYAVAIAQGLGLDPARVVLLRRAAVFHDIGKLAVDSAILGKPGRLDDDEYEQIKLHPIVGATMLLHAGLADEAAWVRGHHERLDGHGYPDGLAGDQIPLEARILFVADAFEAMTSDRPYRTGCSIDDALAELRRCAGTQFDPEVVHALERLIARDQLAVLAVRSGELGGWPLTRLPESSVERRSAAACQRSARPTFPASACGTTS